MRRDCRDVKDLDGSEIFTVIGCFNRIVGEAAICLFGKLIYRLHFRYQIYTLQMPYWIVERCPGGRIWIQHPGNGFPHKDSRSAQGIGSFLRRDDVTPKYLN
jgi:hypothetical protein